MDNHQGRRTENATEHTPTDIASATACVKALSEGFHPITGERLSESIFFDPQVKKALTVCAQVLGNKPATARTPDKKPRHAGQTRLSEHYSRAERRIDLVRRRQINIERGRAAKAGFPWSEQDRKRIGLLFNGGVSLHDIAQRLERSAASIVAELNRQNLIDQQGFCLNSSKVFTPALSKDLPQVNELADARS